MQIPVMKNRKATGQTVNFPKIDDSSFENLVASIGGEQSAFVALKRATSASLKHWVATKTGAGVTGQKLATEAAGYTVNFSTRSGRGKSVVAKTADQIEKITDPVAKAQMVADLERMIADLKTSKAAA